MLAKSINRYAATCRVASLRKFSTAADEYHSLDDHLFYVPHRPVDFQGAPKLTLFDNVNGVSERRFAPFELKEMTFKNFMGFSFSVIMDHFSMFAGFTPLILSGWCLNWSYGCYKMLNTSIS